MWEPNGSYCIRKKGGPAFRPASRLTAFREFYYGLGTATWQTMPFGPTGQTNSPLGCPKAGEMTALAGGAGVQPLPSHAAAKSTDRRAVAKLPNMEISTQFWLVVRALTAPATEVAQTARPAPQNPPREAVRLLLAPAIVLAPLLLRLRYIQPPTSAPSMAGKFPPLEALRDVSGRGGMPPGPHNGEQIDPAPKPMESSCSSKRTIPVTTSAEFGSTSQFPVGATNVARLVPPVTPSRQILKSVARPLAPPWTYRAANVEGSGG